MNTKKPDIEAYLAGKLALADSFNPGFRRDMHLARERLRRLQRRAYRSISTGHQA